MDFHLHLTHHNFAHQTYRVFSSLRDETLTAIATTATAITAAAVGVVVAIAIDAAIFSIFSWCC